MRSHYLGFEFVVQDNVLTVRRLAEDRVVFTTEARTSCYLNPTSDREVCIGGHIFWNDGATLFVRDRSNVVHALGPIGSDRTMVNWFG